MYVLSKQTKTWNLIPNNLEAQNLIIDNQDQIYLQTFKGVFKSVDKGKSWISLNDGLTNLHVNELIFDSDQNLFAATQDGVFQLVLNANRWTRIDGLDQVDALHLGFNENDLGNTKTLYAITKTQIFKRVIK